jgi:tetratricopeptide (TPR) repeat protein
MGEPPFVLMLRWTPTIGGTVKILLSLLLLVPVQDDIYKEGKAQLEARRYDAAESAFRQLVDADAPTASKGHEGLALVEIGRKNYDKALEYATKAVQLDSENPDAHYALALVHAYRQDFKSAVPSLEKVIALRPDNAYAHYQLGLAQYRLKRYDQTIIHFQKFIQLAPNAPEAPQVKSILKTVGG